MIPSGSEKEPSDGKEPANPDAPSHSGDHGCSVKLEPLVVRGSVADGNEPNFDRRTGPDTEREEERERERLSGIALKGGKALSAAGEVRQLLAQPHRHHHYYCCCCCPYCHPVSAVRVSM